MALSDEAQVESTSRPGPSAGRRVAVPLAALAGAVIGMALAPPVQGDVGPFVVSAVARPALASSTTVQLAPLGSILLDTHAGPVGLDMRLEELRAADAQAIALDPGSLAGLEDDLAGDARRLLGAAAVRALAAGLVGALVGAFLARRRWRSLATGALVGSVFLGGAGASAAITFDAAAVAEPRYTGLLALAPTAVGDVEDVLDRFGEYRAQLTDLVANAVLLYRAGQQLPDLEFGGDVIRILHVSDIHNNPQALDLIAQLVDDFAVNAVFDTGDISDWGTGAETRLTEPIAGLAVPYVFVRGNHDSARTQAAIAALPNAIVLDGEATTVAGLAVWGIGDPRFTPDKSGETGAEVEKAQIEEFAPHVRRELRRDAPATVDVVLVHDPRAATEIEGLVPLVLAGHTHEPRAERRESTLLLVEGSTGGAGLRGLEGEFPEPLTCALLYFDRSSNRLVAYDRITVEGLGGSGARIQRELLPPQPEGQ